MVSYVCCVSPAESERLLEEVKVAKRLNIAVQFVHSNEAS